MIRTMAAMITVVVMTIIIGLTIIITGPFNRYSRVINVLGGIWSRSLLWAAGVKVKVEGMENIDPGKSYMVMANHQSHYDVPAIFGMVTMLTMRFFTKKELFSIPLFGWALKWAGMVKIDRSNRKEAINSMNEAVDIIHKGVSLAVFPEGTRSTDGKIQAFKKGGFVIAIRGNIPILPVSISGSSFILKKHTLRIDPGLIKIVFDKPIETKDYSLDNKNELIAKTRNIIEKNIDKEINERLI